LEITLFQQSNKNQVINLLQEVRKKHINIKFNFDQFCNYVLTKESEDHCQINLKSFQTKTLSHTMCEKGNLIEIINDLYNHLVCA